MKLQIERKILSGSTSFSWGTWEVTGDGVMKLWTSVGPERKVSEGHTVLPVARAAVPDPVD